MAVREGGKPPGLSVGPESSEQSALWPRWFELTVSVVGETTAAITDRAKRATVIGTRSNKTYNPHRPAHSVDCFSRSQSQLNSARSNTYDGPVLPSPGWQWNCPLRLGFPTPAPAPP